MKLEVGRRYLASDRNRKPTVWFTVKDRKDQRFWGKLLREGTISVTPAN